MKLLRNLLLLVTGLLLLIAVAAPGVIGPQVETVWQEQLGRIEGLERSEYRRGWFGAETQMQIATGDGPAVLRSEIQHGPLLFTSGGPRLGAVYSVTTLETEQLPQPLRAQLRAFYGRLAHSPVRLETVVGVDNNIDNTLRLQPFARSDAGGELEFAGAELVLQTDYSGAVLSGAVRLGEIRRREGDHEKFYSQAADGQLTIVPGRSLEGGLQWPLVKAETESGPVELRRVRLDLALNLTGGGVKLESIFTAPQVQSATPVSAVSQRILVPEVAPAVLAHYVSQLLPPTGGRNWAEVFGPPLSLQQQLLVESANGPAMVDADIDWRGYRTGAGGGAQISEQWPMPMPGQAAGAAQWLAPMTGIIQVTAAEQALLQSPLIGQTLLLRQYGLLEKKDGELQMLLEVKRGDLKVNGQRLPADLFLMALTGQF
ncbi:hypothetical protein Maes01_00942 [Microbulbifer aestuariivivens]|uniref:DUF945 family protein n=1 Tax=Microbulbifer aestuariivivens TaxID=1908308 RepID=A0ABP9WMQ8_9GAMM